MAFAHIALLFKAACRDPKSEICVFSQISFILALHEVNSVKDGITAFVIKHTFSRRNDFCADVLERLIGTHIVMPPRKIIQLVLKRIEIVL